MGRVLAALVSVFLPLSFFTIGGGQAILAEVQRQTVTVHHWLTRGEFGDLFAISRMAPGPGSLYITLIGWHVAGIPGAVAVTLAIFLPTMLLTYAIAGFWSRWEKRDWQIAFETGLKPVAAGLVLASVYVLVVNLNGGWWARGIAALSTAGAVATRINPLLLLAIGAALYVALHFGLGV